MNNKFLALVLALTFAAGVSLIIGACSSKNELLGLDNTFIITDIADPYPQDSIVSYDYQNISSGNTFYFRDTVNKFHVGDTVKFKKY